MTGQLKLFEAGQRYKLIRHTRTSKTRRERATQILKVGFKIRAAIEAFRPGDMSSRQMTYRVTDRNINSYRHASRSEGNFEGEFHKNE